MGPNRIEGHRGQVALPNTMKPQTPGNLAATLGRRSKRVRVMLLTIFISKCLKNKVDWIYQKKKKTKHTKKTKNPVCHPHFRLWRRKDDFSMLTYLTTVEVPGDFDWLFWSMKPRHIYLFSPCLWLHCSWHPIEEHVTPGPLHGYESQCSKVHSANVYFACRGQEPNPVV